MVRHSVDQQQGRKRTKTVYGIETRTDEIQVESIRRDGIREVEWNKTIVKIKQEVRKTGKD